MSWARGTGQRVYRRGDTLPPPRPGVRYVGVPLTDRIIVADDALRAHVDRRFHWPMIILALAVLPLLAVELFYLHGRPDRVFTPTWWVCATASGVIWLAFATEFAIKVGISENRVEYVRHNWIDIIIILMPVLRPLRVAYVGKSVKALTLRGVGLKVLKYLFAVFIGLEATNRLLHRIGFKINDGRRKPEEMTREQLMREVAQLRQSVDAWEDWHARWQDHEAELDAAPASSSTPASEEPPAVGELST